MKYNNGKNRITSVPERKEVLQHPKKKKTHRRFQGYMLKKLKHKANKEFFFKYQGIQFQFWKTLRKKKFTEELKQKKTVNCTCMRC